MLDIQLSSLGLTSVDVMGDGNCFFRAACLVLYGDDNRHVTLRHDVAAHIEREGAILGGVADVSPDDGETFLMHVQSLYANGTPVGEDAILALANICHRIVVIHLADVAPQPYSPADGDIRGSSVNLAFYEPGHYRAVLPVSPDAHSSRH
jgi:hypothetical protein